MADLRLRQVERYDYHDAHQFLKSLREIEAQIALSGLSYKVRSLHTRKLRNSHEQRQAALFTCGMAQRFPEFKFDFSQVEHADYDAVIRWYRQGELNYTPVQLKELVPTGLNADCTFDDVIAGLEKYADSKDLVVAVFLNRRLKGFNIASYKLPLLNLAGLFLFGAARPDQSQWNLIGDLLHDPTITTFDYPR